MSRIQVVEVGPRDGLQNEKNVLSINSKLQFIHHLVESGLTRIEVGAFVSPKWVPQMVNSLELVKLLYQEGRPKAQFSALVPNVLGMTSALETPLPEVAIFGSCTESFSLKNINCSIAESLERYQAVCKLAKKNKRKVRGYLSVAFGCPYEGQVSEKKVVELAKAYLAMGVYEISVGDTIGVANPKQVSSLIKKLKKHIPSKKLAMHFHDTRGTALANVLASLKQGIKVFDSSFGGLGGCPYAQGASGNLSTEDLVYMLHGMGFKTGVSLPKLLEFTQSMEKEVAHKLPSRTAEAGLPVLSQKKPSKSERT